MFIASNESLSNKVIERSIKNGYIMSLQKDPPSFSCKGINLQDTTGLTKR